MTRIAAALRKVGWIGKEPAIAWEEAGDWQDGGVPLVGDAAAEPVPMWPLPSVHQVDAQPGGRDPGTQPDMRGLAERPPLPGAADRHPRPAHPFRPPDISAWSDSGDERAVDAGAEMSGLVTRVFAAPPAGAGARVVLFCAVDAEEPTHTIASDAALVVAEKTASPVCLVHIRGNLRPFEPVRSGEPALTVVTMDADTACRRLSELSRQFASVVLCASEAAVSAPILALASLVDGTVLLVSEHRTRRKAARTAVDAIQKSARLVGVVLTDRSYPIPAAIYRRL